MQDIHDRVEVLGQSVPEGATFSFPKSPQKLSAGIEPEARALMKKPIPQERPQLRQPRAEMDLR
jgi:hypothetical protein